ncbi:DUF4271 domain-containing protein [Rufibacter latericius]|uniref:DUF4271 domain-containing protein n=1 Tax=Rufibacter latericius TaxID=2487040 RepID=A0A3M9MF89_9BACT|nr:DUF4271 domain-containing protein [Rufibacter latericius]RNI23523.1 DUF4271 domain-containing protein [Rufibacter latericius]
MRFWGAFIGLWFWCGIALGQPENLKPLLSSDWLIYQAPQNKLVPYLPEFHDEHQALYQWVSVDKFTNLRIEFAARQELCLFLDNRLVFVADSTARYTVDLSPYLKPGRKYLLTVWHPDQQPDYPSFKVPQEQLPSLSSRPSAVYRPLPKQPDTHRSALIFFMVVVGLIYGALRMTFYTDFVSIFRWSSFTKLSTLEEGLLAKPVGNWSSILFVLAFALSFALLIVAIHTNLEDLALLNQLFTATQADLISKILLYALMIFLFVLFKYLFLRLMGFIFGVGEMVLSQYREFLRTLLGMGLFLPFVLLLYLGFWSSTPQLVYWIANVSITALLVFTVIRTFYTVSKKYSLKNLHLFSYLCATEVIPLMILLKLIVFV